MEERVPIIIKKVKKGGGGHHGGSWKVAYADFVTAMMAFFLLLWLLEMSTPEDLRAISAYFTNPIQYNESLGTAENIVSTGEIGSNSIIDLGFVASPQPEKFDTPTLDPELGGEADTIDEQRAQEVVDDAERERLEELKQEIQDSIDQDAQLTSLKDQILLDITSEGLRIQLVDKTNRPMFASGSPELKFYTVDLLIKLASSLSTVPNKISITGHTDATLFAYGDDYSNWELSADRANAARRALSDGGLGDQRFSRVVGLSSTVLFDKQDPYNPINRRISIIVLNQQHEEELLEQDAAAFTPDAPAAEPLLGDSLPAELQELADQPFPQPEQEAEDQEPPVDSLILDQESVLEFLAP